MSVELFNNNNQEEIGNAWGQGLTYKGKDIFETYMNIMDRIQKVLMEDERICDSQESYLGYDPDTGDFFSGFDTWCEDEYEDETDNVIRISFNDDCAVTRLRAEYGIEGRMMYPQGFKELREKYPNMIHLRLD